MSLDGEWRIERAASALSHGDTTGAIDHLRSALGDNPENARAHALLAFALLSSRRRHAARHEAALAVACDPELGLGHRVRGYVALAENDLGAASTAFHEALALEPLDEQNLLGMARCHLASRKFPDAMRQIERVLELDANSGDALEVKARLELMQGSLAAAEDSAQRALALDPESPEALTLLGSVRLRSGDTQAARDLALWALQVDPSDDSALRLMSDIKARESWLLGAWWRLMTWLSRLGSERAVLVLTMLYVVHQAIQLVLRDFDWDSAAIGFSLLWLVFCAYTWGAGSIQQRMVTKELEQVRLKPGF